MAQFIRVRKIKRKPVRLGTVNVSNAPGGSLINLDDPATLRDLRNTDWNNIQIIDTSLDELPAGSPTIANFPAGSCTTTLTTPLTSAKLRFTPLFLQAGTTVNSLTYQAVAASVTLTASWAAFFTFAANLTAVAVSANVATAEWGPDAKRVFAMTTPYVVPTTGVYLAALAVVAATTPTLIGQNVSSAASLSSSSVDVQIWPKFAMNGNEGTATRTTTPLVVGAGTGTVAATDVTADAKVPLVQVA